MDVNKVTQELLVTGYTEADIPPGMHAYDRFHGGFTYTYQTMCTLVFETPCGLLVEGVHFSNGMLSYMGVDWMPENDNPVICCPQFSREPCTLNHPLLRSGWGHKEKIVECACHKTDREYCYENSIDKVHDDVWKEADDLFQVFSESKCGRVCKLCSQYNRRTKTWAMFYDPIHQCARMNCSFCTVLQKELSPKKGNVFYDIKTTWVEKGQGLFPDVQRVSVEKGKKMLDKTASMTLCEVIAKSQVKEIRERSKARNERDFGHSETIKVLNVEVINVRAERRESRDLLQDLQGVAEGIKVVHAGDTIKAAAQQKRERKQKRQTAKITRLERLISENGYGALEDLDKRRIRKYLEPCRITELQRQWMQKKTAAAEPVAQMSLF